MNQTEPLSPGSLPETKPVEEPSQKEAPAKEEMPLAPKEAEEQAELVTPEMIIVEPEEPKEQVEKKQEVGESQSVITDRDVSGQEITIEQAFDLQEKISE